MMKRMRQMGGRKGMEMKEDAVSSARGVETSRIGGRKSVI